jgi:hypothetical protein
MCQINVRLALLLPALVMPIGCGGQAAHVDREPAEPVLSDPAADGASDGRGTQTVVSSYAAISGSYEISPQVSSATPPSDCVAESCEDRVKRECGKLCESWLMHVRPGPDGAPELVSFGGNRELDSVALERDGDIWRTLGPLRLVQELIYHSDVGWVVRLRADEIAFTFYDTDDDGLVDTMQAFGEGVYRHGSDDDVWESSVKLELSGSRDEAAPSFEASIGALLPSEPLAPGLEVALVNEAGLSLPVDVIEQHRVVLEARLARIPASESAWQWRLSGHDLAGNAAEVTQTVYTLRYPDPLEDGGFESEVVPFTVAPSSFVNSRTSETKSVAEHNGIPPITGKRSFFVQSGVDVLFRLQRLPSESRLMATSRVMGTDYGLGCDLALGVGVVGGTWSWTSIPYVPTIEYEWGASPVQTVEIELPVEGDEVLFKVSTPAISGSVGCWLEALLDDVRLE